MKATKKERAYPQKEVEIFPVLMTTRKGLVVLFTTDVEGVVVYSDDPQNLVGEYSRFWDIENFTPFIGEIKLTNSGYCDSNCTHQRAGARLIESAIINVAILPLPKLVQLDYTGTILLLFNKNKGIVVATKGITSELGEYVDPVETEQQVNDYHGVVILEGISYKL